MPEMTRAREPARRQLRDRAAAGASPGAASAAACASAAAVRPRHVAPDAEVRDAARGRARAGRDRARARPAEGRRSAACSSSTSRRRTCRATASSGCSPPCATVAAEGIGVLFVTHRLEEVRALTDRVTILRDGAHVETAATASLSEHDLIERILGRRAGRAVPERARDAGRARAARARRQRQRRRATFSIDVRRGEIVGLTGLLGMGHEQVPHLLFGSQRAESRRRSSIGGRDLRPAPHVAARGDRRRPRAAARQPAPRRRRAGAPP